MVATSTHKTARNWLAKSFSFLIFSNAKNVKSQIILIHDRVLSKVKVVSSFGSIKMLQLTLNNNWRWNYFHLFTVCYFFCLFAYQSTDNIQSFFLNWFQDVFDHSSLFSCLFWNHFKTILQSFSRCFRLSIGPVFDSLLFFCNLPFAVNNRPRNHFSDSEFFSSIFMRIENTQ